MLNMSGIRAARPSDDDGTADMDNWLLEDNNVERGDTESIFRELGETINSDFHSTLLDLKNSPELDIWPELYHNSLSLYKAMDILHKKEPRHSGVKSASRHAFLEVRGYGLLMCEQELVEEFEQYKDTSTLASLICGNKDFRQIYALWRWCQDAEGIDAGSFGDLAEEYALLGKIHNARSGSLRALSSGQKGYGLDFDAAAPEENQEVLNRHIRAVFSCIRSCKIDEAIQLAHDNGLPAVAAPIKLYKFLVDPRLSSSDPMNENHYIAKRWLASARLFHKMVDHQASTTGTYTRMLWAAVSGRLQPILSMATRTSDRLWCFANAALMNMLLEACTGEYLEDVPKSVQTIFSEITAEEKSPYYSIYPYLLRDDWDGLINWLVEHTENRLAAGSSMDDQFVRFMATLGTIARLKQHQHDEVAATTLFTLYIDRLVEKASFGVIPFFASFLPRQTAEDRLQDIMEHVQGDVNRGEYLLALESSDFDRDYMAITAASETGDLRPITRIDNLRWLLINGERTLDSCLSQINCLVRYFTVNDDHQTAIEVLTESVRFQVPEKLKTVQDSAPLKSLAPVYASNIAEYECHYLYHFEAFPSCEKFSEQAIQIKKLLTDAKSRPSTANINFREMRLQQATAQAVKDMNREAEIGRRKSTAQIMKQKTIELIEKLLLHKGWYCQLPDQTQRSEEMTKVRNISCSGVIELYLASCYAIEDHQAVVDAGILLAKPEIHIDKVLGRDDLRRILKKIESFSKTTLR